VTARAGTGYRGYPVTRGGAGMTKQDRTGPALRFSAGSWRVFALPV